MEVKSVEYMLSVHFLKDLKNKRLISEEEYIAIDQMNRKSFIPNKQAD